MAESVAYHKRIHGVNRIFPLKPIHDNLTSKNDIDHYFDQIKLNEEQRKFLKTKTQSYLKTV